MGNRGTIIQQIGRTGARSDVRLAALVGTAMLLRGRATARRIVGPTIRAGGGHPHFAARSPTF